MRKGPVCLIAPVVPASVSSPDSARTDIYAEDFGNAIANTVTVGSSSITRSSGDLAVGRALSTITVNVISASAATYTNGAANVTTSFVKPPAIGVTFLLKVDVSVTKDDGGTTCSPDGAAVYIITVANARPSIASGIASGDVLPPGATVNGTWTCAGAGGSSCSAAAPNAPLLTIPAGTAPPGSSTAVLIQLPATYGSSPANC